MAERERQIAGRTPSRALAPFDEMERMFEDFFRRPFAPALWQRQLTDMEELVVPNVDIFEEGDTLVVKAEVPGMSKEDIEVTFSGNTVTISGEKKKEEKVEKKNYYRLERAYGSFNRSFTLPAEVDREKAEATFKDGILEIRLPRTEESRQKVRKIDIK